MNRKQRRALRKLKADPARILSLGIEAHKRARFAEAEKCYRSVLDILPDHADALHFLGILMHQRGDPHAGIKLVQRSLAICPENVHALNNLGNIRKETGDLEEAALCYEKALALQPDHVDALNNLGIVRKVRGEFDAALETFRKALQISPNNPDIYQNLCNCYRKMEKFDEAIDCYWKAIHFRPYDESEYSYLRQVLYAAGQAEKASKLIDEWLERDPTNPTALHLRATYHSELVPDRADQGYVRKTFDEFASSFDSVLQNLDYRAPEFVSELINARFAGATHPVAILDAGCGTGLCGPLIKVSRARLDGVDLSPGMLEKAAKRAVYTELFEAELTAFIGALNEAYDAILSADTLVYFGDLRPVFEAAFRALRDRGVLIFTVEKSHRGEGFELQPHGRYCHTDDYLRSTLESSGFSIASMDTVVLRRELGEEVEGFLIEAVISKSGRLG